MQVIFIRHGSAEPAGPAGDAARGLTDLGRRQVRTTAAALVALGVGLKRVLCSPLVRAVQTGEIVAETHGVGEAQEVGFLVPPGDYNELAAVLQDCHAAGDSAVALIGHAPSLNELLGELVAGKPEIGVRLSTADAACVELSEDGRRAELRWLMRSEQLAALAHGE